MCAGVIIPTDRIARKYLDCLEQKGVEDTVRLLAKEELSRPRFTMDSLYKNPAASSIYDATNQYSSRDDFTQLSQLSLETRMNVVKVFELYARDLSNLILREMKYWTFSKNSVALAIVMYTRASLFETSNTW